MTSLWPLPSRGWPGCLLAAEQRRPILRPQEQPQHGLDIGV